MPIYTSPDWSQPLPQIRRVVVVIHGVDRNADSYLRGAEAARAAAGNDGAATLLVVPQILADIDVQTFHLPPSVLHWDSDLWAGGLPAYGPAPLSAFDVFDTILRRVADRTLLPNLQEVVVAGHSAGAQVVQRYAAVSPDSAALAAAGIRLRFVVANPSSYLYFSPDRPEKVDPASCPDYNRWRYGLAAGAPPYVGDTTGLEARYASRDITYLLGTADIDPHHPALDTSCAAEAEGPYRLARGQAFFAYMQARHPGTLPQRLALIPGVAHSAGKMFSSACGLAALFEHPGCPDL